MLLRTHPPGSDKLQKPAKRRAVVKNEARRKQGLTRRQVVAKVWLRDKGLCVRCGKTCKKWVETYPSDLDRGEVHEPEGRATGAHLDPARCVLLCRGCHFSKPSGGHIGRGAQ